MTAAKIEKIVELLKTGPVLFGENHYLFEAREAIVKLMERGAVKKISVELPLAWTHKKKQSEWTAHMIKRYFKAFGTRVKENDSYPLADLISRARTRQCIVYFHDLPVKAMVKIIASAFCEKKKDLPQFKTELTDFISGIYNHNRKKKRRIPAIERLMINNRWVCERNHFTKTYLQKELGQLSLTNKWEGVIILAGDDHTSKSIFGEDRLQKLLGIAEKRVFHCN